jgi:hypothetical protein
MLKTKVINTKTHSFIKPEIKLLLLCSRTRLNDSIKQQINYWTKQNIDWEYLISTAYQHGLLPLLFNNLNNTCPEAVPKDILTNLRNCFQSNVQRNLLLTAELLKILNLLKANQIEALPFKGATLAAKAYGQIALRQFCDLDILIEEKNAQKVVDLLVSIGYQLPDPMAKLEDRPYMKYKIFLESEKTQKKYNLIHTQKRIAIDLQWSLTERRITRFFPVNFSHLHAHSQLVSLGGMEVRQFSSEDTLLYLCFHGSKHCWSELKWICDVAEFVTSHPEIDWSIVQQRAQKWKVSRMLNLGLFLAMDLLSLSLPAAVQQNMKVDQVIESLANNVKYGLFEQVFTETEKIAFRFKLRTQISEQIAYAMDVLLTPTAKEWHYVKLPKFCLFLYRFIRPYRLMIEFSKDNS